MAAIPTEKRRVRAAFRWQLDPERCFPHVVEHMGCAICMAVCPHANPQARHKLAERWSAGWPLAAAG